MREFSLQRCFNFTTIFPKFRGDKRQPNWSVNLLFIPPTDFFLAPKYSVFIYFQTLRDCQFPKPDIMSFGAGKIAKRCSKAIRVYHAEIHLNTSPCSNAWFCSSFGLDCFHKGKVSKKIHYLFWLRRNGQYVYVLNGFPLATDTSCHTYLFYFF